MKLTDITPEQFERAARIRKQITSLENDLGKIFASANGKRTPAERTSAPSLTSAATAPITRRPKTVKRNWTPEARAKASRNMKRRWNKIKKAIKSGSTPPVAVTA